VTREAAAAEEIPGGYSIIYPALKKMEESGLIRRGMFVSGLGAAQFAMPAAVDMLRGLRSASSEPESVVLAATDPANPYGAILPWAQNEEQPTDNSSAHAMARVSGASVILVDGQLVAFVRRRNPAIRVILPDAEPERSQTAAKLARQMAELAVVRQKGRGLGFLIGKINDVPTREHFLARFLEEAGFNDSAGGYYMRRVTSVVQPSFEEEDEPESTEHQNTPEIA
jgi:ATP-dependent Lhr-like helicase